VVGQTGSSALSRETGGSLLSGPALRRALPVAALSSIPFWSPFPLHRTLTVSPGPSLCLQAAAPPAGGGSATPETRPPAPTAPPARVSALRAQPAPLEAPAQTRPVAFARPATRAAPSQQRSRTA